VIDVNDDVRNVEQISCLDNEVDIIINSEAFLVYRSGSRILTQDLSQNFYQLKRLQKNHWDKSLLSC